MSSAPKPTFFTTPAEWRAWLEANHATTAAKRPETRAKRLRQLIDACAEGRRMDGMKPAGGSP